MSETLPAELTPAEILDVADTIRTVAQDGFDGPISKTHREALRHLLRVDLDIDEQLLVYDLLDGPTLSLPLNLGDVMALHDLLGRLPDTSEADEDAWLAARAADEQRKQRRTTETTTREQRQRDAALAAGSILALPLPGIGGVYIDYSGNLSVNLLGDSLDRARLELHQFAAILDDPKWTLDPHLKGQKKLQVAGTHQGVRVEIWKLLDGLGSVTVAELSASPESEIHTEAAQAEMANAR